jgi:hypothetical protein
VDSISEVSTLVTVLLAKVSRILLFVMRCFLVFILLLNISVREGCTTSTIKNFQAIGGVMPFDYAVVRITPVVAQFRAIDAFGYMDNYGKLTHPALLNQGIQNPCSSGVGVACQSHFYMQSPKTIIDQTLGDAAPNPGILVLYQTPFYEIVFSWEKSANVEGVNFACENYHGILGDRLKVCAGAENSGNQSSVIFGISLEICS